MGNSPADSADLVRPCQVSGTSLFSPALSAPDDRKTVELPPAELSPRQRRQLAVVGSALIAALAVAYWLQPDPRGRGTHRQLGLPPCTFLLIFGWPCPSCGMTTSWAHLMNGNLSLAAQTNLGGTLLALASLAAGPWLAACALRGRWLLSRPNDRWLALAAAAWIGVTLFDWCRRTMFH